MSRPPNDGTGGRLSRWSRRKLEARERARTRSPRRGAAAPVPLAPDAPAAEPDDETSAVARAPEAETPAPPPELPSIEDLNAESDYTGFLAEGVPEAVKRAALRTLWRSDPVLANLDGLNDYDEDFNLVDRLIGLADTGYKIGRGFLDDVETDAAENTETDDSDKEQTAVAADRPEDAGADPEGETSGDGEVADSGKPPESGEPT